jgi:hypothetical protein
MRIAQTKEQISALRSFQDHCEIESVLLQSCSSMRAKAGARFTDPYTVKPSLSNVSGHQDGGTFVVEVSFDYSAWDSADPPERLFQVNCTFEVCYRLLDGYVPNDEEKSSFTRGTAVFNCWPYAREFFRDITARMGEATPVLPLLRITPKRSEPAPEALPAEAPQPALDKPTE